MSESIKPPTWFWVVAILALLWNFVGVFNYLHQAYDKAAILEGLDQAQRDVVLGIPAWATAAFAIAVFAGALASIGLLLRKKWARPIFVISLLALVAQFIHWLIISEAVAVFGPTTYIMPLIVVAIAMYLVSFSKKGIQRGWLE